MKLKNPKTGELLDIQDEEGAREGAIAKGYIPVVAVRNPKTKEVHHIDDREIGEAIKKGYEYDAGAVGEVKPKEHGIVDTLMRGVAQGATLGFADELAGAVGGGIDALTSDKTFTEGYRESRDAARKGDAEAQDQNSKTYLAGNLLGGLATGGAVTGGLAKAGATGLKGVVAGGAIDALGQSDADLTKGEVGDAAMDVAGGAALAGGMGLVGKGLGKVVDSLADQQGIRDAAAEHAVKSLNPILSQQEVLNNRGLSKELGRELLDQKVVGFGDDVKAMQPKLEELLGKKGKAIGALRKEAQDAGHTIDLTDLKTKSEGMLADAANGLDTDRALANVYRNNVKSLGQVPERSVEDTQDIIHRINNTLNFNKATNKITPAEEARMALRKDLVGKVDEAVGKLGDDKAVMYDKLKKQFGLFKEGDKILDKSVARAERNRGLSLTDYITGASALSGGDGMAAAALAMANKIARERGNASMAVALNKLGNSQSLNKLGKFAKPLTDALQRGEAAVAATHAILMRDPEYKAIIEQQD